MIYTDLTKKAMNLCFEAHKNQKDKSGQPYVFHPFHLAEQMETEATTVAALLHDVVEDTDYSFDDLISMGFPAEIVSSLRLLTHDFGADYFAYVSALKNDPVARAVKIADLTHNSDLTRLDPNEITERDLARAEKYKKALEILL